MLATSMVPAINITDILLNIYSNISSPKAAPRIILCCGFQDPRKRNKNSALKALNSLKTKGKGEKMALLFSFPSPIYVQQRAADRNHPKIREGEETHGEKATRT